MISHQYVTKIGHREVKWFIRKELQISAKIVEPKNAKTFVNISFTRNIVIKHFKIPPTWQQTIKHISCLQQRIQTRNVSTQGTVFRTNNMYTCFCHNFCYRYCKLIPAKEENKGGRRGAFQKFNTFLLRCTLVWLSTSTCK